MCGLFVNGFHGGPTFVRSDAQPVVRAEDRGSRRKGHNGGNQPVEAFFRLYVNEDGYLRLEKYKSETRARAH